MTPQTLEQFGLMTEQIPAIEREMAALTAYNRKAISKHEMFRIGTWLGVTAILVAVWGWIWVPLSVILVLPVVGGLFEKIYPLTSCLKSSPPNHTALRNYREALKLYEEWWMRTQQTFWDSLSGREFEIECANLLNKHGYGARVTAQGGDGGVDLLLLGGVIVQCKSHCAPVGPAVARDLYGTLIHNQAPRALLISRGGYTSGVRSFVKGKPIDLWDIGNLINLQKSLTDSSQPTEPRSEALPNFDPA